MDYEKKYKEAQKWIESIYSELSHEQQMEAEAFFPELKESEDERMMHQLHSWMKEFGGAEEYTEKVYTWLKSLLEKQGQTYIKKDVDDAYVEGIASAKNELKKQGESELKDNKDEKIRKVLIDFFGKGAKNGAQTNGVYDKDIIAWLEKQGEKTKPIEGFDTEFERQISHLIASAIDREHEYNEGYVKWTANALLEYAKRELEKQGSDISSFPKEQQVFMQKYISLDKITLIKLLAERDANNAEIIESFEKQGERKSTDNLTQQEAMDIAVAKCFEQGGQKPVDKVEPKFHEGDWITNGDYTWKIVEVKPLDYILQSQDGNIVDDTISHVDEQFHSFTIQDAKDGDVLAVEPIKDCPDSFIAIYKERGLNFFNSYCFVSLDGEFNKGTTGHDIYLIHPATKEQCDTLFAKMKEAGYEWDAENKELKKIEKKSQRMISAEAKNALYDKPTDNDIVEALRMEYEKGRADVLRCIDPDEMVADFYSQPLSKTRSLASIYRQGIMDVLKRINNNEETSITNTRSIDDCGL